MPQEAGYYFREPNGTKQSSLRFLNQSKEKEWRCDNMGVYQLYSRGTVRKKQTWRTPYTRSVHITPAMQNTILVTFDWPKALTIWGSSAISVFLFLNFCCQGEYDPTSSSINIHSSGSWRPSTGLQQRITRNMLSARWLELNLFYFVTKLLLAFFHVLAGTFVVIANAQ
jgi:hypothetical protein